MTERIAPGLYRIPVPLPGNPLRELNSYLLTGGGPFSLDYYQAGKTDLLVTWLYKLTVNRNDYSLASTIGIFIFLLVGTCSLLVYNRTGAVRKEDQFQ